MAINLSTISTQELLNEIKRRGGIETLIFQEFDKIYNKGNISNHQHKKFLEFFLNIPKYLIIDGIKLIVRNAGFIEEFSNADEVCVIKRVFMVKESEEKISDWIEGSGHVIIIKD